MSEDFLPPNTAPTAVSRISRISIEENEDRTKIVIPIRRIWPFWLTYTALLITWWGSTFWALQTLFGYVQSGNYGFEGLYLFAWIVILIIIAGLWVWLGSMVWKRWQYYSANREILFFYGDKLIVRRPLSLLGVTDAYDLAYVSPFVYDEKVSAAAFDYGSYRIPVGTTLPQEEAQALVDVINGRFYPDHVALDDDEEE